MVRTYQKLVCPAAILAVILAATPHLAAQPAPVLTVDGVVRDSTGAVIRGASVHLQSGAFHAKTQTDDRGRFSFAGVPAAPGSLQIEAEGFLSASKAFSPNAVASLHLEFTLHPSPTREQVVVSAARAEVRLSDAPGSNILLSNTDLSAAPALRTDDVLREVPGFSLFRRSDSRFANASNQGFSLRGLGGSAASRALLLADGISLIDPFGGWVYWDRIPRTAISTVEVVRGGASNLYGSDALGGVVQVLMRQPEAPAFALETSYGNENTPDLSFWTGSRRGPWDYSASTEMFRTDGFIVVPESERGPVDKPANVKDATVLARIGHSLGSNGRIFGRGNYFTELRHNGPILETNDTQIGEGALGIDKPFGGNDSLSVRLYGDAEDYYQTNSSVTETTVPRDTDTLTSIQHVPEQAAGGGAQWTHLLGSSQTLIGGMDLVEVIGASRDVLFSGPNDGRTGSGRQRTLGWFGEDIFHRSNWTVILAARLDDWNNFNGQLVLFPVSGAAPTVTTYASRSDLAFSPRLSVLRALNQHVSVTSSIYRAFRAPTLNELYRTFRVGSVVTANNPDLKAERLTGAEAGLNVTAWDRRLDVRGTFFWSDIVDPIENVYVSTTGTTVNQEKENLGRTRSRGVELDSIVHISRDVQVTASYAYTQATVLSYPGNPGGIDYVGLYVPEVPRNVFTCEARYWHPSRLFLSVQGRFIGRQFDDAANQYPLNNFFAMNLEAGRDLTRNVQLFVASENLTNQRYQVANTADPAAPSGSLINQGPPALVRVGLRLNFPAAQ
jgi:outer membrane receptor protein involved in Fe transport